MRLVGLPMRRQRRPFDELPGTASMRDDLLGYHPSIRVVSVPPSGRVLIFDSAISIDRRNSSSSVQLVMGAFVAPAFA